MNTVSGSVKVSNGPNRWSWFITTSSNKKELFEFLSNEAMKHHFPPGNNDFYITLKDHVMHNGRGNEMMELSNHEEADTRIVVHLVNAPQTCDSILVQQVILISSP